VNRSLLPRHLRSRLFASYLVVVAAGVPVMVVVGAVVTRSVYEHRLGRFGLGRGPGRQAGDDLVTESELRSVLDDSLLPAVLAGTAAALVVAVLLAWLLGRRLLRPLDQVRGAAQRMAAGDYDVSVPVPAEAELASLAHDVNELGAHLATTERRRTRLLGEVTHELRTPITVIRGQMEGMLDGLVPPSDEAFATVADEATRMQRLVDDLVTLSRAEEGALELHLADVDLAALVAATADRLGPQFVHAGVGLTTRAATAVPVRGDADRLMQVLSNLVGNALGSTSPGDEVTIVAGAEAGLGWVDVIDSGRGIVGDELEHIFERFYRVPGDGRRAGRGLGLTIARSLARAHGGDVVAHSDGPGTGARFRLTVPLAIPTGSWPETPRTGRDAPR
jgi:signal transduction histidine kinase